MAISEDKVRVVAYLDRGVVAQLEKAADEFGISVSSAVAACVECGLDDLQFFRFLGLTPRRIVLLKKVYERLREKYRTKVEGSEGTA